MKTNGELRDFYKGLIQTAAVFLKLQQGKTRAGSSCLAQRAASHLQKYPPRCECISVERVLSWLDADVVRGRNLVVISEGNPPHLEFLDT